MLFWSLICFHWCYLYTVNHHTLLVYQQGKYKYFNAKYNRIYVIAIVDNDPRFIFLEVIMLENIVWQLQSSSCGGSEQFTTCTV